MWVNISLSRFGFRPEFSRGREIGRGRDREVRSGMVTLFDEGRKLSRRSVGFLPPQAFSAGSRKK